MGDKNQRVILYLIFVLQSMHPWGDSKRMISGTPCPDGITCSKLTMETLEQDVKYVQSVSYVFQSVSL